LQFGFGGINNGLLTLTNSYIAGGAIDLVVSRWQGGMVTGNTVYANGATLNGATVNLTRIAGNIFNWNSNTYYTQEHVANCAVGGNRRTPFTYNGATSSCGGQEIDFTEWKTTTGYDASSTLTQSVPPNAIFVKANAYEAGRANIAVFNWSGSSTVNVDVSSVLASGDQYALYAVEDLSTPQATGTWTSGTISISMASKAPPTPIGHSLTPASTRPIFGAFVIKKTN
jgi:hypothetical protein